MTRISTVKRSPVKRPARTIIPPDVVDGAPPERPILVRTVTLRQAGAWKKAKPTWWKMLEITIPREVIETTGLEAGMTMQMEAYRNGRIRMYPAGDILNREDEQL
jgi:hypothetical protein